MEKKSLVRVIGTPGFDDCNRHILIASMSGSGVKYVPSVQRLTHFWLHSSLSKRSKQTDTVGHRVSNMSLLKLPTKIQKKNAGNLNFPQVF